ncbi:MAG TPA: hypothetical protein PLZ75_11595 [Bacteroidales bacterium]|jgi:hypothetical protein|nr:hypothetical protein [Bacteroidales bacterium]HQH25373.1 hypothetical protein [Bacteroidales bacterium]HQJ82959.1 hypothetical protein [Bacteroidales bacterium]
MKRLAKIIIFSFLISVSMTGCYAGKRNLRELGGLMMLDNTQQKRNRAFYSGHNKKARKNVHSKYRKAPEKSYKKTFRAFR